MRNNKSKVLLLGISAAVGLGALCSLLLFGVPGGDARHASGNVREKLEGIGEFANQLVQGQVDAETVATRTPTYVPESSANGASTFVRESNVATQLDLSFYAGKQVAPGLESDELGSRPLTSDEFLIVGGTLHQWQLELTELVARQLPGAFAEPLDAQAALQAVENGALLLPKPMMIAHETGSKYLCPANFTHQLGELRMLYSIALDSSSYREETEAAMLVDAQERFPSAALRLVHDGARHTCTVQDEQGRNLTGYHISIPGE